MMLLFTFLLSGALADPHKETIHSPKNSKCSVKDLAGDYSDVRVVREGKEIYKVENDSTVIKFSKSGRYIAFTSSDMDSFKLGDANFKLLLFNCETAQVKGFFPSLPLPSDIEESAEAFLSEVVWQKQDQSLRAKDCYYSKDKKRKTNQVCKPVRLNFAEVSLP